MDDTAFNLTAKGMNLRICKTLDNKFAVFQKGIKIPIAKFATRPQAVTWCNNYSPNQTQII